MATSTQIVSGLRLFFYLWIGVFSLLTGHSQQDFSDKKVREGAVTELSNRYDQGRQDARRLFMRSARGAFGNSTVQDIEFWRWEGVENGILRIYTPINDRAAISLNVPPVNSSPFNANGQGYRVGVWDGSTRVFNNDGDQIDGGGNVRSTHQELVGRVEFGDVRSGPNGHATHVSGTIAAAGVNPRAKGMASAVTIHARDFSNFVSEMAEMASATGEDDLLLVSNGSFSTIDGWTEILDANGNPTPRYFGNWETDTGTATMFGSYSSTSRAIDEICFNAPYFLPFFGTGNDRNDDAPEEGSNCFLRVNGELVITNYNSAIHPGPDFVLGGYDTIGPFAGSKNVMSVGAVDDAINANGERDITQATQSTFAGWGPIDDGRIKPDIVANGVALFSCNATTNNTYDLRQGTSMSTPNASGSAILLQEIYKNTFGNHMRASTLKGLIIHTADDIGRPGPDYENGWGLMNTLAAAELIRDDRTSPVDFIQELELSQGEVITRVVHLASNNGSDLKGTICWTDPEGTRKSIDDDPSRSLVNDLDLRITRTTGATTLPWRLNPSIPSGVANRGDNRVDNVEQVIVPSATIGTYTITIAHKGTLQNSQQKVSLILSTSGGTLAEVSQTPPAITSATTASGNVGTAFRYNATADGSTPIIWSLEGTLPTGLTLNPSTGVISGTPNEGGTYNVTLEASNGAGTDRQSLRITIIAPPGILSPGTATGVIGTGFTYRIVAKNNPTSYAYSGTLPRGIEYIASTATFSGTPTTAGQWNVEVRATNAAGTGRRNVLITIGDRIPVITSASDSTADVQKPYSFQFRASGNPSLWLLSGALPAGVTLNTQTGRLSGTPTVGGTFTVTMRARNATGTSASQSFTLTVRNIPTVTSSGNTGGTVGQPFAYRIVANNNPTSYSYIGTLPPGVRFTSGTGTFSGTPTVADQWTIEVRAANAAGTGRKNLIITIRDRIPLITSGNAHTVNIRQAFSYQLQATGNPTLWLIEGSLPQGVSLNAQTGLISGTPTSIVGGTYILTLRARNASGTSAPKTFALVVRDVPSITSLTTANGTVGGTLSYRITATSAPTSYSYSGTLPPGIQFASSTATFSGRPTSAGEWNIQLRATNPAGTGTRNLRITITGGAVPVVTRAEDFSGYIRKALSYQLRANNSPTSWLISGALPSGVTLNTGTGLIAGTPTVAGEFTVTIRARNTSGNSAPKTLTLTVVDVPRITSSDTATGLVGNPFVYRILATNDPTGYSTSGTLPTWISLNRSNGVLSGTPPTAGEWSFTIRATNGAGSRIIGLRITINNRLATITSPSTASGSIYRDFAYQGTGTGDPTWSVVGELPTGLTINPATGLIAGRPTVDGVFVVSLRAANESGIRAKTLTITIVGLPRITSPSNASARVGQPFSYQIVALNNPTSYSASGTLPSWLRVNGSTGALTGTPNVAGTWTFTIRAINAAAPFVKGLTITVADGPPSITGETSATGYLNQTFSFQPTANGNPTSWEVFGTLPNGVAFNTATGRFTGRPTQTGTFALTLRARNAVGTGSRTLRITVIRPPSITSATTASAAVGSSFSYRIIATGPVSAYSLSGTLPPGLRFNAATATLFGTPTTAGQWNLTQGANNAAGSTFKGLRITIQDARPIITSPATASGKVGQAFNYTITASNDPTAYAAFGTMPPGLSLSGNRISGTPTRDSVWRLTLRATNSAGVGLKFLVITIDANTPRFIIPNITQNFTTDTLPGMSAGWTFNSTAGGRQEIIDGALFQFSDANAAYSRNEAILHVDPRSDYRLFLHFRARNNRDENHTMPATFSGSVNADGIAMSVNGTDWIRLFNGDDMLYQEWDDFVIDVGAVIATLDPPRADDLYIKFQQYDNLSTNADGRQWDSIRLHRQDQTPDVVMFADNENTTISEYFNVAPTPKRGWTTESTTTAGRIVRTVDGRLRLDSTSSTLPNLNRAILHVDLSQVDRATLTFWHRHGGEALNPLAANASSGDGVVFSLDGVTWYPIGTLRPSPPGAWQNETFDLHTAFEARGLTFTDHVRIGFQQSGPRPYPSGGRDFESIVIRGSDGSL